MVKLLPIMLASIENLTHVNGSTNTIKSSNTENKVAKALLICHPSSHNFVDRTLVLDKPIKIGRSVGHNKTSVNNGIFDCKVLSRNHALLWYDDGKFWLRDTRSSNGTFVNTERLSKSCEESVPREIFSGDTVQFGVDVVENCKNVTHGCVIATLQLFLPNGREAFPVPMIIPPGDRSKVNLEDLYLLNQYLQESLQREQMLESKLNSLQTLVKTLRDSTELSWKALISNNSLLSRVELLEVQLKCYSKKFAEDKLREELRTLQEDKNAYEGVVKEYFQKILDEKLEAAQQCQDLNRALSNMKTEYSNVQLLLTNCQNELRELASKNTMQEKNIEELEVKLNLSEEKCKNMEKLNEENVELRNRLEDLNNTKEVLQMTIKELETHGDYAHKQMMSLQNQVEELQKHHSDILCELVDPNIIKNKITDIGLMKSWISIYVEALRKCKDNTKAIQERLEQLRCEKSTKQQHVTMLESEVNQCIFELQDFKKEKIDIETKIIERKNELEMFKPVPDIMDELNEKKYEENDVLDLQEKKKLLSVIQRDIKMTDEHFKELEKLLKTSKEELTQLTVSYAIEEDKLDLSKKQTTNLENAVRTLQEHVDNLDIYHKEPIRIEDVHSLKKQLSEAHVLAEDRKDLTVKLVKSFANFTHSVNQRLNTLDQSLSDLVTLNELAAFVDEIEFLGVKSSELKNAIEELQNASKKSVVNSFPHECNNDELVILKEKLGAIYFEKRNLEARLEKLQEQFEYLKSYPYFDMYFIIPIIVLICFCIFNFGDKLSFIFGTWNWN